MTWKNSIFTWFAGILTLLPLSAENARGRVGLRVTREETFVHQGERFAYRENLFTLNLHASDEANLSGGHRHLYRIFKLPDVQDTEALGNGHAHQTGPWLQHTWESGHLTLHPVLAVSSNVLRNPRHLDFQDLQLHGILSRSDAGWGHGEWEWGIRADSRWSRYLPYPFVQWHTSPTKSTHLALGLPDSEAVWSPHPHWALRLETGPDGGNWRVRDADFEQTARLRQRRWHTGATVQWLALENITLSAGANLYHNQRWSYGLEDGARAELSIPNGNAYWVGITAGW